MKKIGLITDKSNEMELLACPSETLMVIEAVESKSSVEGVPDNNPALPHRHIQSKIGRASCRERVCQYV